MMYLFVYWLASEAFDFDGSDDVFMDEIFLLVYDVW